MDRRFFSEEEVWPVERKIPVDFIRRNLMEPLYAVLSACIHQYGRAHYIGLQKDAGVLDRAVHVGFRRKVDDDLGLLFLKELLHAFSVTDVQLYKAEVRMLHYRLQCGEIARICETVHTDDPVFRVLVEHIKNKVGTDKPGSSGNNDIHDSSSCAWKYVVFNYKGFTC